MSIQGKIVIILLCFVLLFSHIRGFLYGVIRHQLDESEYMERKKGQTVVEWLLYSRYKRETPVFFRVFYYFVLLIHPACLVVCVVLHNIGLPCDVGEIIVISISLFGVLSSVIIPALFLRRNGEIAYDRWIKKDKQNQE